jgi:deoxyribodipyrimidine photo-lyase
MGVPLLVRVGDAVAVLERLCRQHRITRIVSHEETGNLWTYARDRRVAAWARGAGVTWTEVPQSGVVRRLGSREGWAAQRDGFMAGPVLPPPALTAVPGAEPGPIPSARALRLADDPCPHRQHGGRDRGLDLMDSFLTRRGEPYRTAMSSPVTGERACSRLSPHLAWGTLSLREVVQATATRQATRPGGRWGGALASFQSRLAWRDHFMQKLEDQPSIERRDLHPAAILHPRDSDAARLEAWMTGATGLPYLDACLRYLRATGWLNFRMRAMVMSFASYHLWLDWRMTGQHLARMFTDYEPGIHWPQVQMQSGTTGINTPRIYNPVKQGHDQDPTGAFIRAWVPELAAVPDSFLHEPWKWPEARRLLGHRYPEPILDLATAARAARDRIWSARKTPDFQGPAAKIVQRHASRAEARFASHRKAARHRPTGAQLVLDL